MSNFTKFLSIIGLLCCSLFATAQPEILIQPTAADGNVGDVVTVDVKVVDFINLSGLTFSVEWNESLLGYDNIGNFNPSLGLSPGGNFNTSFTGDGQLGFTWDNFAAGVTLTPDTVTIFSIDLEILQAGGELSRLNITSFPAILEVLEQDMSGLRDITPMTTITSGPATEAGYNVAPDPCDGVTDIAHILTDEMGATGTQICVDVQACNFVEVEAMQYTIEYNPNVLRFDSVTNFGITRLDENSFAHNIPPQIPLGFITFAWPDSAVGGVSAANGDILYSLCFTAIGAGGDQDTIEITSSINTIEVVDTSGMPQTFASGGGLIEVTGAGGGAVSLNAGSETGNPGDNICVDVTATNFTNLIDLEFSMGWDPAIADFDRIETTTAFNGANAPTFDTSPGLTSTGRLSFDWSNGSTPYDISDGTVLFQVCFDITGTPGSSTTVDFTNDPLAQSGTRDDGMGGTEPATIAGTSGNVSIIGSGTFQLIAADTIGASGDTVCVPVTVKGFNELLGVQFELRWDETVLDLLTPSGVINNLPAQTFEFEKAGGAYFVSWSDAALAGVTIPDDSVIYEFCFELIGMDGDSSILTFADVEVGKDSMGSLVNVPFVTTEGKVVIGVPEPLAVADTTITDILCKGDATGAIDITVMGGESPYTFAWSNAETTEDISGLTAGDYTVTVTDMGGTTITENYTISEPADTLGHSLAVTSVACNGNSDGSIDLTPSGGTAPYTFAWSNMETTEDISGLAPGTYTLTLTDANNCQLVDSATITQPPLLGVNASLNGPSCNGDTTGRLDLTIVGGTPPYVNYDWNFDQYDGMSNLMSIPAGTYTVTVTDDAGCTASRTLTVLQPDLLALSGTVTDETMPSANDGTIDLTVSGGITPYTYSWSNSATTEDLSSLPPGTYTVTVVDGNGCDATTNFVVNAADAPDISVSLVTPVDCKGDSTGAIDVTISSGTPPYTFAWSNGATTEDVNNLPAGTYTVTVTDASMISAISQPIVVSEPTDALTVTTTETDPSCGNVNDGSISLNVSGGTGAYTYSWNNSLPAQPNQTGLAEGTYNVTVTDDNGCTATASVLLSAPPAVNVTAFGTSEVVCNGDATGSVNITVTGGVAPYTFSWNDTNNSQTEDLSNVTAGDYTVTITDDNGCSFTFGPYTVTERPAMSLSSTVIVDARCFEEANGSIDIEVTGGTPPYTYAWENVDSGTPLGTTQDLMNLRGGNHSVTITDSEGCTFTPTPIFVDEPAEIVVNNNIRNASALNNDGAIATTVSGGTSPYTYSWDGPSFSSTNKDINNLMPGFYFLTVTDDNGCEQFVDSLRVRGVVTITSRVTDVTCFDGDDGEIDITVTAGVAPYTFSWSDAPIITEDRVNLAAGTYTVTITDALGSELIQTFEIEQAPPIELASVTVQDETGAGCNGSINIQITGGTLPLTYQWSNGSSSEDLSNLCKGDYSVTVIDANGCTLTPGNFIVNPPQLIFASVNADDVSCSDENDGEICVTVLGGCEPYTYTLDGGLMREISLSNEVCFDRLAPSTYNISVIDRFGTEINTTATVDAPDPLVISVDDVQDNTDPNRVNCNGAIQISVAGGTGQYTFQWSNGMSSEDVSGLCDNLDYSVTVTDANGCTQSVSGIEIDLGLSIRTDVVNTCFGECDGTIDIEVAGGLPPYAYQWSDGPVDEDRGLLCAGVYRLTITDSDGNVLTSNAISVLEPSEEIVISGTITHPTGNNSDGAIVIDVTGGWGGYTYEWSGPNGPVGTSKNISGLVEGNYTIVVTDRQNCEQTAFFTLRGERVEINIVEMREPTCNGDDDGRIEVEATGGTPPYTYEWANGVNQPVNGRLIAGDYELTVTDANGLTATATITLTQPDALTITFADPTSTTLQAMVSGGTAPYRYQWNTENRDSTAIISAECGTDYTVLVTDINNCTALMLGEKDDCGSDPISECENVRKVFTPNNDGNNDVFTIQCEGDPELRLLIFNRYGQLVFETDNYDQSWDGTNERGNPLPEGGYFYILEYNKSTNGEFIQEKGYVNIVR